MPETEINQTANADVIAMMTGNQPIPAPAPITKVETPAAETAKETTEAKPIETTATIETKVEETTSTEIPETTQKFLVPETKETPAFELTSEHRLNAINEALGTSYKSLDEVATAKTQLAEVPTYKAKLEEATKKPKFANERIEELNTFASATGIDDASIHSSIKRYQNATDKDPVEAMVLAQIIKNPELVDDKTMLRELINDNYNLNVDPDADPIDEARRIDKIKFKMKIDAQGANDLISSTMEKVKTYKEALPPEPEKVNQQKVEADQKLWEGTIVDNKFKELFKTVEMKLPEVKMSNGETISLDPVKYELTAEQQGKMDAQIKEYVKASGLDYTQENVDNTIALYKKVAEMEYFPIMLNQVVTKAVAKAELAIAKKIHNATDVKVETPVKTDTGLSQKQQTEKALIDA